MAKLLGVSCLTRELNAKRAPVKSLFLIVLKRRVGEFIQDPENLPTDLVLNNDPLQTTLDDYMKVPASSNQIDEHRPKQDDKAPWRLLRGTLQMPAHLA